MMNSWIDSYEDAEEVICPIPEEADERICTFCDRMSVCVLMFGELSVHLCEAHTEPREN